MDQWNDGQRPDMSVSGQFEGVAGQDQGKTQAQNLFQNNDAGGYGQPQNGGYSGGYGQPQNGGYSGGYGQPQNGGYSGGYGQPQNGGYSGGYGQPQNGGYSGGYGQPQNGGYPGGYGQPYAYGMPTYQESGYEKVEMEEPVGVGEWIGLLAIAAFVPFVGLILILIWAVSGKGKKSKSNFCKAYLLIALIKLVLWALVFIWWGTAMAAAGA